MKKYSKSIQKWFFYGSKKIVFFRFVSFLFKLMVFVPITVELAIAIC